MFDTRYIQEYFKTICHSIGITDVYTGHAYREKSDYRLPSADIILQSGKADNKMQGRIDCSNIPDLLGKIAKNYDRTINIIVKIITNKYHAGVQTGNYIDRLVSLFYRELPTSEVEIGTLDSPIVSYDDQKRNCWIGDISEYYEEDIDKMKPIFTCELSIPVSFNEYVNI